MCEIAHVFVCVCVCIQELGLAQSEVPVLSLKRLFRVKRSPLTHPSPTE